MVEGEPITLGAGGAVCLRKGTVVTVVPGLGESRNMESRLRELGTAG